VIYFLLAAAAALAVAFLCRKAETEMGEAVRKARDW